MRIIKEKVRFTGRDVNVKLTFSSNNNINGLQESIDDFIEAETGLSINPVIDGETFRTKTEDTNTFTFNFYGDSGNPIFDNDLTLDGFTASEISESNDVVRGSFYLMQIFDSFNKENQTLLHSGFLNGSKITGSTTTYVIDENDEFSCLYIPENFITSVTSSTVTLYARFFFFNAKTNFLQVFYNQNNESLTTEEKLYYEVVLDPTTRSYNFETTNIVLKQSINNTYNTLLNNRLPKFRLEKPNYPTGEFFSNDGTYDEIENVNS
jgi:hypothetical protein